MEWQFDSSAQEYIRIAKDLGEEIPQEAYPPEISDNIFDVVEFFRKVSTQWNVGISGITGLNYAGVEAVAKAYQFELTSFRMMLIQEIEQFYLEFNRKD